VQGGVKHSVLSVIQKNYKQKIYSSWIPTK